MTDEEVNAIIHNANSGPQLREWAAWNMERLTRDQWCRIGDASFDLDDVKAKDSKSYPTAWK